MTLTPSRPYPFQSWKEKWLSNHPGKEEYRTLIHPSLTGGYIEGFDEQSPWGYVALGIGGLALGIISLVLSRVARKSKGLNDLLDMVDR